MGEGYVPLLLLEFEVLLPESQIRTVAKRCREDSKEINFEKKKRSAQEWIH
jgi:hypothetical protein